MPTVPTIDQTAVGAQPFSTPTVAPMRNAAPEEMQSLGAGMLQAGGTAFRTGQTIGDAVAAQVDDAQVKKAETAYLQQANTILYDPQGGYLRKLGQSAIDGYSDASGALAKAGDDALGSAANPIQKHMLRQAIMSHQFAFGKQMADHNFQQTSQYSGEAAAARAQTYANSAANAWQSYGQTDADGALSGDFYRNAQISDQEILNTARITKGAPADSDVAKTALLNNHTQMGVAVLSQMIDNHAPYQRVQQVYDDLKAKDWLDFRALDSLGKTVKSYASAEFTRQTVTDVLSDAQRAAANQPTSSTGTPDYQFPARGATVTSQPFNPETGAVSVTVAPGSAIQAPAKGTITQVGRDDNGDFTLKIQHANGSITSLTGLQAANVKAGDTVQTGETIATSGTVGGKPGLSWSLADKNGNAVNPTAAGLAPIDINKITDEKVLSAALATIPQITSDPVMQQQIRSEMEGIVRHNIQQDNEAKAQRYQQASDQYYKNGMNWRAIDPTLFHSLSGEQQHELQTKQQEETMRLYNYGQFLKNASEVDIVSDFYANPQALTPENVEAARDKLSNSTYLSFMRQAGEMQQNPRGVVEAQGLSDSLKYFASSQGINVAPKSPADKQTWNTLNYLVNEGVNQVKAQNHGKITQDQQDQVIRQLLIKHQFQIPDWWDGAKMSKPMFNFQLPAGATRTVTGPDRKLHYTNDTGTVDYGVVE